ncbi:AEC family transporter [Piscinibacter terrae]|uniref:AEC family transporter n=1 Tax=Piscinibacter terrae TaxID=2496871 RepID=A0A3N7JZ39_9BURK|nr:AEC family transporter [Albitalea terrae]RQP24085.1 AEC family transporter [Albitalea terrae]
MEAILAVTIPFFALVLCGYLAAWRGVLPEMAIPGLNIFVLFFALPCMLFRFGSSMPFAQLIDPTLIGIYALSALMMVFVTVAATWRRHDDGHGVDLKNAAFGALVAAFPNSGFMGVPLLAALFGDRAAGPVIGTVLIDLIFTSTLCLAIAQSHLAVGGTAPAHPIAGALRSMRGAMTNPLPWAIALGAVFAATGLQLPGPVAQIIKMLADAATPVALFTIGAVLWRAGQHAHTRTPVINYLPVALIKLLIHPLLVWSLGMLARKAGLPVPPFGLAMLVLAAALPSASNVSLLAERYGADNGRIARIIMASTTLAFVSFSLLAWAFR